MQKLFNNKKIKQIIGLAVSLGRAAAGKILKSKFIQQFSAAARRLEKIIRRLPFGNRLLDQKAFKKSYALFLLCSIAVSLGFFYFMSILISSEKDLKPSSFQSAGIEFLMNLREEDLELRSRKIPKKPEEAKPPPETPKLKTKPMELEKPELSAQLPKLDLPKDFKSDRGGAGAALQGSQDRSVAPVFRINPIYPRKAALQNIEGFVILKFDITEEGQTDNISVLQASPPQIFNSSALKALRKWKYKPRIEKGRAVRQNNLKVQLDFKLEN